MANRDKGVKKWQFAFGMPEQIKMVRDVWKDDERIKKPIIDEYEMDEFDQRICYVMEFNLAVKIVVLGRWLYLGYCWKNSLRAP